MVHAHYNELDAIYAFNSQASQCLYYVIIRIIRAGVSLFKILLLINGWVLIGTKPVVEVVFYSTDCS